MPCSWPLQQTRAASGSQHRPVLAPWPRSNSFSQPGRRQGKSRQSGDRLCEGAGGPLLARLGPGSRGSQRFFRGTQASCCCVDAREAREQGQRPSAPVLACSAWPHCPVTSQLVSHFPHTSSLRTSPQDQDSSIRGHANTPNQVFWQNRRQSPCQCITSLTRPRPGAVCIPSSQQRKLRLRQMVRDHPGKEGLGSGLRSLTSEPTFPPGDSLVPY